jgi:hypothetical protein
MRKAVTKNLVELQEILDAVNLGRIILLKKKEKHDFQTSSGTYNRSDRGSQFRGVSRNGKKWQVYTLHHNSSS